jgi:HAD superfamily hydrolase (TIGR01549 family)
LAEIDGRPWRRIGFSSRLACEECGREFDEPEPRLFSFNSPLGACPECEGFGNVIGIDMELVVPDPSKSIRDGAIAPWNSPAYAHELEELLDLAPDYDLPVDVPFSELDERHLGLITHGVPKRDFGGLEGFFATVVCLEDAPRKPDPAPVRLAMDRLSVARAWMVGDTPDDARAARRAGVLPIGIVSGDDGLDASQTAVGAARLIGNAGDVLDRLEVIA